MKNEYALVKTSLNNSRHLITHLVVFHKKLKQLLAISVKRNKVLFVFPYATRIYITIRITRT